MSRPARLCIDTQALRHNYRLLRELNGARVLAVLKADAYGHGAVQCAAALADCADGFAVAFGAEASALREAGVRQPILVLEGLFDAAELQVAMREQWWIVVHHEEQLRMIERSTCARGLNVWLKIDTGMHRCGFEPSAVLPAHARLAASGKVASITLMSHFARADEPDLEYTRSQIECFEQATAGLPGPRSLANSAGVLCWPAARGDWARCGLALYGLHPASASAPALRPVMSARSEVIAVREIAAGEPVGYGAHFVAAARTRVGLVAFGYADGYPRAARNGTPVSVDGHRVPLIGRVSMDMLAVDLSGAPPARIGSPVELWGREVAAGEVAACAGTIPYELLCNAKRAPRLYGVSAA